jgi:signal transduction histidine kinase
VTVELIDEPDVGIVRVSDQGEGIPESERANVFRRFYRIDKSRSQDTPGSGLGLAITHAIVDGHGGTITLADRAPHGLIVRIELPLGAQAPQPSTGRTDRGDTPQRRAGIRT